MNYNDFTLLGLGILGILLHGLFNINKLKKTKLPDGKMYDFKIGEYFSMEWASIGTSLVMVIIVIMIKSEVKQLQDAGKWLGLGVASIGFMSQSILASVMTKVQNKLGIKDENQ